MECPVVVEWSGERLFTIFGISKVGNGEFDKLDESRYWLYPRKLDNSTYVDRTIMVNGVAKDLVLYWSEKFTNYGVRVTDLVCYLKLVKLLNTGTLNHVVRIESLVKTVSLFGEVVIGDRTSVKRYFPVYPSYYPGVYYPRYYPGLYYPRYYPWGK